MSSGHIGESGIFLHVMAPNTHQFSPLTEKWSLHELKLQSKAGENSGRKIQTLTADGDKTF